MSLNLWCAEVPNLYQTPTSVTRYCLNHNGGWQTTMNRYLTWVRGIIYDGVHPRDRKGVRYADCEFGRHKGKFLRAINKHGKLTFGSD